MAVDAVVMGLGRFGGGLSAAESLLAEGRQVLVTDLAEEEALQASVTKLRETFGAQVSFRLGGHDQEDFAQAELVIANPAVPQPWKNPYLKSAWQAGATITTEIARTLSQLSDRKTIAITGSAGKSTTTAMTHAALVAAGIPATRGGNLGESLLGTPKDHTLVVELSSAMAWWLYEAPKAPQPTFDVALRTNLAPNHVDWHGDMGHYAQCKQAILDHAKVSLDGSTLSSYEGELLVPGHHNRINAAAALAAVTALAPHPPAADFAKGLALFTGLPHRLERVVVPHFPDNGFWNDSKATTAEAVALAIAAVREKGPVRLIAGGRSKGASITPLAELTRQCVKTYTIGEMGNVLSEKATGSSECCATLETAVGRALGELAPGEQLLLSPGGTSWDQFENYEIRGQVFQRQLTQTVR
jgi:UDP-N-acetylmuramoylalanine--D-glutamate ligase